MRAVVALVVSLIVLSGCASIVSGTTQTVWVQTISNGAGVPDANCAVASGNRGAQHIIAPRLVLVHRSSRALNIACVKPGYSNGAAVASASVEPWILGNVVFGGLVGLIIDLSDGAADNYPHEVKVAMNALPPSPPVAPVASTAPPASVTVATK